MYSTSFARIAQRVLALVACTGAILLLTAGSALAAHQGGLDIDAASWDGATLTADGGADKPNKGGGPVELFDAADDSSLGLANLPNSGNWDYSGAICADSIYATQDGIATASFAVAGPGCGGMTTTTTTAATTTTTTFTSTTTTSTSATTSTTGSTTTTTLPPPPTFPDQTDFKIMMNYELGMHCTGFEFAYCCVLPVYNSILAQVVKPNTIDPDDNSDYARLMEGDPGVGTDGLGRQTVLRDLELDNNGNFKKYVLKYWHDAQARNDGRGKAQTSTLISAAEGNSLMSWNTVFDSAALNPDGSFVTGTYNGVTGVVLGDGDTTDTTDNYQNAVWNHLYFYEDLEGSNSTGTSLEADKIRLGVTGMVEYKKNCGPALHPLGPTGNGDDGGDCGTGVGNLLTYSGEHGTVVFTQMKVLENLPIMLTSPDIWEALGLPLTTFEDSIDFFGDPGLVDEDSVRPFVVMNAQMYHFDGANNDTPVLDDQGNPVVGFGTAPIDIPNCERCHSNAPNTPNTPNNDPAQWALVEQEYMFWNSFYGIDTGAGDSDWYSRLKSAAISMLHGHDVEHGTSFTDNYPGTGAGLPQNTRLGHESIICQKCHADNVIAVVKSATCGPGSPNPNDPESCEEGDTIKPITEAIHTNHRGVSEGGDITFGDSQGRSGGCQGCHPAHRSNGDMAGYPITLTGENFYATTDNRDANGGCFVGRDVHSNPNKDTDGAETPLHLNPVGEWLSSNVFNDGNSANGGLWCTNCHQQLGQELWKAENVQSLVHAQPGDAGHVREPFAGATLADVAAGIGISEAQAISWLDPKDTNAVDDTHTIWKSDPGLCNYVAGYFGVIPVDPAHDGNVATVEVNVNSAAGCSTGDGTGLIVCSADYPGAPDFHICGSLDGDGDFSVSLLDFCSTPDCVTDAQATLPGGSVAVPVPMSAATDGRDHWLSPGEPHCADCHAAPYVEQSGNINAFPPFNYPRKASLMRYSRGHQDISCQGCHESIHGLYPVTPDIDTTSYAQAASLNHDGTHGPLKCGTCHEVNGFGVPTHIEDGLLYQGQPIKENYDAAVSWMHTFTAEADGLGDYCLNCHEDNRTEISSTNKTWTEHSFKGRSSREMMDKAEISVLGHVGGDPAFEDPTNTVCTSCHGDRSRTLSRRGCTTKWKNHLIQGRSSEVAWEYMSTTNAGSNCGW